MIIIATSSTPRGYIYTLIDNEGHRVQEFSLFYQDDIELRNTYNIVYPYHVGKGKVRDHKECLVSSIQHIHNLIK